MPRKLRNPKQRFEEITDAELFYLTDGVFGSEPDHRGLWYFQILADDIKRQDFWKLHQAEIMPAWIQERPGQRPSLWWEFTAPEPQRRRLGGIGDANHDVLAYAKSFHYGIPDSGWITQDTIDMYSGRLRDVHGKTITCNGQWHEGHFNGLPIDRANPPAFESQSSYLKRLGLLEPGEERKLTARDFDPEIITADDESLTNEAQESCTCS